MFPLVLLNRDIEYSYYKNPFMKKYFKRNILLNSFEEIEKPNIEKIKHLVVLDGINAYYLMKERNVIKIGYGKRDEIEIMELRNELGFEYPPQLVHEILLKRFKKIGGKEKDFLDKLNLSGKEWNYSFFPK